MNIYFVHAQFQDVSTAASDLIFLTEKYISPAAEASVYQSSGGWFNNFEAKSVFEVELSLQYNVLFIPNKNRSFLVQEDELQNITILGEQASAEIPTALGNDDVVVLQGTINGSPFEFDAPEGINDKTVKHTQLQASIGFWKNTNVIVRYAPNIKINDTSYQSYGVGISHNLNQWIKPLNTSSYQFGLLFNYVFTSVEDTFNPADLLIGMINGIAVNADTFGFNILASKRYRKFDFSATLGLATSKFDYQVSGEGDFIVEILNSSLATLNSSIVNFKADLGLAYRLNNLSFSTMFTLGNYYNLNMGINYRFNR
jgi:hypothetical protein